MSSLASLFAVPLALVGQDKEQSVSNGPGVTGENRSPEKPNDATKSPLTGACAQTSSPNKLSSQICDAEQNKSGQKTKKKKKKKNNKPTFPLQGYIDYDKKLEDDVQHEDSSLRMWSGASAAGSQDSNNSLASLSPPARRDIVSYQEISQPQGMKRQTATCGRGYHNPHMPIPGFVNAGQQQSGNLAWGAKRKSYGAEPPNKFLRLDNVENAPRPVEKFLPPVSSLHFIDPLVLASEKKQLFEKPPPIVDKNVRKPLNSKQRKKIEKAKLYKEKLRQQTEKEKDRIINQKLVQCRFFSFGNCAKGDACPFSHDFEPPKKQELCKFYVMSFCEKGDKCPFYHNDWPCKFFHAYHSCTQGDACKFSHKPLTEETRMLLEKSLADPNQTNGQSVNPPETSVGDKPVQPPTSETQRVSEGGVPRPLNFYSENGAQSSMSTPIMTPHSSNRVHEPWKLKLEPIEFEETHRPRLPSDLKVGSPPFLEDPRVKVYHSNDGSARLRPEPVLLVEQPRFIRFDAHLDASVMSDSWLNGIFPTNCNTDGRRNFSNGDSFPKMDSQQFLHESRKVFSQPMSALSDLAASHHPARLETVEPRTARHISLPLTQLATVLGNSDKSLRNKPTSASVTLGLPPSNSSN